MEDTTPPIVSSHEVTSSSVHTPAMVGKSTGTLKVDSGVCTPQKKQLKLPLGVNRWVLLVLFSIVVLFKGCTYWGWNGIQEMMYKAGKFDWVCRDVPEDSKTFMKVGNVSYVDCPDRKAMINGLFSTAIASHLITSLISGIFLDKFGPKITILVSILLDVLGWCLLFLSTESFQAFYAGAFFLGLSADPGYLPLLFISKLFPSAISLVLSVLGSLRSVSFAVPVILAAIYTQDSIEVDALWKFIVSYVAIGLGTCFIISLFFVPFKKFDDGEDEQVELMGSNSVNNGDSMENKSNNNNSTLNNNNNSTEVIPSFWKILKDPKFLIILPIFIIALIRTEFYTKSNKEQLVIMEYSETEDKYIPGTDLYTLYSVFNILSFLPGPIMGKLVDSYGITFVLFILNTCGVFMFSFLMINNYACKLISILFYFVYTSFVLSNVYCFIAIYFPSVYFGKLCGFVSMMGGLFIFSSVYLYTVSTDILLHMMPYNFLPMDGLLVILGLIVYVFIFILYKISKKEDALKSQELKSAV